MSVFGPVIRTRQPQAPFLASAIDAHGRGPTLELNFINGAGLDSRVSSFARASSGTYFDATGARQTAGTNVPRLDFDPSTHLPRGFLSEFGVTNNLLNSAAPVTQTTASLVVGTYCLWIEGAGSATSSAGTAVGAGFGVATAGSPNVFTTTGAGTVVVTVSGSVTAFQLEKVGFPTSFIATAGVTANRAQDIASMPVGSWLKASAGTFVIEAMFYSVTGGTVFAIGDNTTSNQLFLQRNASGFIQPKMTLGGVAVAITGGLAAINTPVKIAIAYTASAFQLLVSGGALQSANASSSAALWTTMNLGDQAPNGAQMLGWLRRVRYWPRVLSPGEMQQVTL